MNKSSMAIGATAVLLAACGTTQQATVSPADLKCGFLGPACAQLSPGSEGQIALRYVNPAAKWTQYSKIMIQPVTFWGDEQSKVSTEIGRASCRKEWRAGRSKEHEHTSAQ